MTPRSEPPSPASGGETHRADRARVTPFSWPSLALLVALSVPLFFVGMGRVALLDPDEPYYAVPALEMLRAGTWSVPLFHGQPWFDKPVLFYWVILGAFRLLGTTELAARIGSGLAALAGVLAIYFFALRRRSPDGRPERLAPLLPALILATSLEYAFLARFAITDMTLTLFLTLGMIASHRFLETGRARGMALAGVAFGLATLTKGPVGLVLPVLSLGLWSALARRRDFLRPTALAAAGLGAAIAAGPWYVYMGIAHRDLLLGTFLGQGNLGRFLEPEHQTNPFFYVAVLAVGLLPWSGALPLALVESVRRAVRGAAPGPRSAGRTGTGELGERTVAGREPARVSATPLFELCWFATVLLVFSVSASRLASYILPAFPPAALFIGDFWSRRLDSGPRAATGRRDRAWALPGIIGVPCALILVLGARSTAAEEWVSDPSSLTTFGLILGGCSIVASLFARLQRARAFLAVQAATSVILMLFGVFLAAPHAESRRSARPLIAELRRRGLEAEVVGAMHERDYSLDFYLGRTLPRATGRRSLQAAVARHPGGIWIVPRANVEQVTKNRRLTVIPIAEAPTASALRLSPSADFAGAGRRLAAPISARESPHPRGNEE